MLCSVAGTTTLDRKCKCISNENMNTQHLSKACHGFSLFSLLKKL